MKFVVVVTIAVCMTLGANAFDVKRFGALKAAHLVGYVDCAASYSSCEACVAPQTESNGARAAPCVWNEESGRCGNNGGGPQYCNGPSNAATMLCNKCKKDYAAWKVANASKLAAQAAQKSKIAAMKAEGKDIGMAGIAGFKQGMCRPSGSLAKGICVESAAKCTGGRADVKTAGCDHCCMMRLKDKNDKCNAYTGKCEACLKAGCKMLKNNLCVGTNYANAGASGTEAGYQGIQQDCKDHKRSEDFRRATKSKELEKKRLARSAPAVPPKV